MQWHCKTYEQLSKAELYAILKARQDVFVVEQQCPYDDIDGDDEQWVHIFATQDDELVSYVRVRPYDTKDNELGRIGRMLVRFEYRRHGLARQTMERALAYFKKNHPSQQGLILSAQVYLIDFYKSLGFTEIGYEYREDGIAHHDLEWRKTTL